MQISDLDAVKFALTAMYAEDMYVEGSLTPAPEPRIKELGWEVVAHFIARDSILPPRNSLQPNEHKTLRLGQMVFYGYLAKSLTDPTVFVAAVRGTEGLAEWIIDADFLTTDYPRLAGATVERGFWSIYDTMELVDLTGKTIGKAADGLAKAIGDGKVTVTGHSLGSALATYLSLDTALHVGTRAFAAMFASPRPGNHVFSAYYDATLGDRYALYNYVLDLVPYVPFSLPLENIDYTPLRQATVVSPLTSQADVKVDVAASHHVICYCAELDYDYTKTTPRTAADDTLYDTCVLGPREFSENEALADLLALAFKALATDGTKLKQIASKMGWRPV